MNNEIQVTDKRHGASPESLPVPTTQNDIIMEAMKRNFEPAFIEKMLDLQERHDKTEARKAYHKAMAAFKANPPQIDKDKTVSFGSGKTSYTHASLANVTDKINKALSLQGLSASWKTEQTNGTITVSCAITHELGHSESTSLTASPDTSGSKNAIQAVGSTISYLERYTILALTGLATHDMDDDAQSAEVEYINDSQFSSLIDMMNEVKADQGKFFKYFKIEKLDQLPAKRFDEAWKMLEQKKK